MTLDGRVEVDVTLTAKGRPPTQFQLQDLVTVRAKFPPDRPETRDSPAAKGPLYREVMANVFEHIAVRIGETLAH